MAEKLTLQQQMVVDNRGGKLLVSAAAGSGKTKVLVDRLMRYINDATDPANIDDFLLITFTEAAASELRGKIASKLSEYIAADPTNRHLQRQMQRLYMTHISTVHAFCAELLREYAYCLDIPGDFRVGDENECVQLREVALEHALEAAYDRIQDDPDFQSFVDTQGAGRNDGLLTQIILSVYESSRCHINPDGWLGECLSNSDVSMVSDVAQTVWGKHLLEDLQVYLDMQISCMEQCACTVAEIPQQEKAAATLRDNVNLLRKLRACDTWDAVVKNSDLDFGTLTFKRKDIDAETVEHVKAVRDACKESLKSKLVRFSDYSGQILADMAACTSATSGLVEVVRSFEANYSRLKRARHILDFNDLEQYTLTLLLGKNRDHTTSAAADIAKRFREIMVDEYQDTNAVQDAIFSVLSADRNNLFMVGDVKQSIYQFRLADPGIFLKKYEEYSGAEDAQPGQGRKILLSSNFRSGGAVLEGVNSVFSLCMSPQVGGLYYGEEESLKEGIDHLLLNEPEVELHGIITAESAYDEEAEFVAERICQLLDGSHMIRDKEALRPIQPEDIVILLRSPGTTGSYFQYALEAKGIPCSCGGSTNLLQMPEIEVLHALLMLISNPRQDIPLVTVLLSPLGGFSADDLAAVRGGNRGAALYDLLCANSSKKCKEFIAMLLALRKFAAVSTLSELLANIFNCTRIDILYSAGEGGEIARTNLLEFYQYASRYAGQNGRNLDQFLRHLDILQNRGLSVERDSNVGCVKVMSIHKSKGLEFPVVFLSGLSKAFNRKDLNPPVLCHKELGLGLSCVDKQTRVRYPAISKHAIAARKIAESLSEELRILYVAMTRARDRLIMTYADKYLEGTLRKLASRSVYSSPQVIASDVKNAGEWILYTALNRTESGPFFAVAGNPGIGAVNKYPWKVTLQRSVIADSVEDEGILSDIPAKSPYPVEKLRALVDFEYPHMAATVAPSKQTATQRKGRQKDQEIIQDAAEPMVVQRVWRKPGDHMHFASGREYGNAIHNFLRFVNFHACTSRENVAQEIRRLQEEGFISSEHARMITPETIYLFFSSDVGKKLITCENVLREYKFSLLDDGSAYDPSLVGEQILLQGVVDCAMVESDGLTVIDFKTDYVTEESLQNVANRYAIQVQTYADALSRIFELPVKDKMLYFFRLNRFFRIE